MLCTTKDGQTIRSEKLLCAAGRVANIDDLKIDNAGLTLNERGHLPVNEHLQTPVSHIYAAGDVIGPPSLASASMEQGRRASCNAFGLPLGQMGNLIPSGIYGIPELSAVGLTEDAARKEYGDGIFVGKANYGEIARGLISGSDKGMLKIICADDGHTVLGVQIVGEGATELIHIGQMAIMGNMDVDFFIESIFNFPTMAEAYRVAALQIYEARHHKRPSN